MQQSATNKILWSSLGIVLLLGAWLLWGSDQPEIGPTPSGGGKIQGEKGRPDDDASNPERREAVVREPEVVVPKTRVGEQTGILEITLIHGDIVDATPAVGVSVCVVLDKDRWNPVIQQSGAAGMCVFKDLPVGEVRAGVVAGVRRSYAIRAGERTAVTWNLDDLIEIVGRVVDPEGRGVPGAVLWATEDPELSGRGIDVCVAGALGAFRIPCLPVGSFLGARSASWAPSVLLRIEKDFDRVEQLIRLGPQGASIEGLVTDLRGKPLLGVVVYVGRRTIGATARDLPLTPQALRTDSEGRFLASGLVKYRSYPIFVRKPGYAATREEVALNEDRKSVHIRLATGAEIYGVVVGESGDPAIGAAIFYQSKVFGADFDGPDWAREIISTDGKGEFLLADLPPGDGVLQGSLGRAGVEGTGEAEVQLTAGTRQRVRLVLGKPKVSQAFTLLGCVRAAGGREVVGARVLLMPDGDGPMLSGKTDREGKFKIERCAAVPTHVQAVVPGTVWPHGLWRRKVDFPVQFLDVQLAVDPSPGSFSWRLDESGSAVVPVTVELRRDGFTHRLPVQARPGTDLKIGPLPGGRFQVAVSRGELRQDLGTHEVLPGQVVRLGSVRFGAAGKLQVDVAGVDAQAIIELVSPQGGSIGSAPVKNGIASFDALLPGRYVARLVTIDGGMDARPVAVRAGKQARVRFDMRPLRRISVELRGLGKGEELQLVYFRGDAKLPLSEAPMQDYSESQRQSLVIRAAPGDYRVVATRRGQPPQTVRFRVDAKTTKLVIPVAGS